MLKVTWLVLLNSSITDSVKQSDAISVIGWLNNFKVFRHLHH